VSRHRADVARWSRSPPAGSCSIPFVHRASPPRRRTPRTGGNVARRSSSPTCLGGDGFELREVPVPQCRGVEPESSSSLLMRAAVPRGAPVENEYPPVVTRRERQAKRLMYEVFDRSPEFAGAVIPASPPVIAEIELHAQRNRFEISICGEASASSRQSAARRAGPSTSASKSLSPPSRAPACPKYGISVSLQSRRPDLSTPLAFIPCLNYR
jgi:hypothetical protein